MDDVEKQILTYLKENGKASRAELEEYTNKSRATVTNRLNNLIEKGTIKANGDTHQPMRTYELL